MLGLESKIALRRLRRAGWHPWQMAWLLALRILWQRGWFQLDTERDHLHPWERVRLTAYRDRLASNTDN